MGFVLGEAQCEDAHEEEGVEGEIGGCGCLSRGGVEVFKVFAADGAVEGG